MKKVVIIIFLILSIIGFYKINNLNYEIIKKTKLNIIEHPEGLIKKDIAKVASFGFENLRANIYWLETIQYVGKNAIKANYKVYLYKMLDLITELNPYFSHPYKLGLLLLPDYNKRYEALDLKIQNQHKEEAIKIGLKGIQKLCNLDKVEKIKKESNLTKIWTNEEYMDPCLDSEIPYYLAFAYYFYLNNPSESAKYYKVASANKDSLKGSRILAAIMQGKGGNREKAFFMFISMAKSTSNKQDEICYKFSDQLENIGIGIFTNKIVFNGKLLENISKLRDDFVGEYKEKTENTNGLCKNYLNKATRELNLAYIEKANKRYKEEHKGKSALDTEQLYKEGYINYKPIDYQQSNNYGIIYKYNHNTGNFDYEMADK